jgi:hypothetical protein
MIRRSVPAAPTVERLVAAATLAQLAHRHSQAGGHDPRCLSRQALLQRGAPLRSGAARRAVKKRLLKRRRGLLQYVNQKRALRAQRGERLGSLEYRQEFQKLAEEFRALPPAERAQFAIAGLPQGPLAVGLTYADLVGTDLWGLSSESWPLAPEAASRVVERTVGLGRGGLTSRLEPFRAACVDRTFVADAGVTCGQP